MLSSATSLSLQILQKWQILYNIGWTYKTYIPDINTGRIISHVAFFYDITSKVPAPFQTDIIVDEQKICLGVSVDAKGEY